MRPADPGDGSPTFSFSSMGSVRTGAAVLCRATTHLLRLKQLALQRELVDIQEAYALRDTPSMSSKKKVVSTDFKSVLRAAGLRATWPRIAVLRLLEVKSSPMSHAEVHEELGMKEFDKATIYRNLVDLAEAGILRRSDHGDHAWRFEMKKGAAGEDGEHPHFVCTDCGTVACLETVEVKVTNTRNVPRSVAAKAVQVKLQGLCDECG